MSLTFQALCYLHSFDRHLPLTNGVLSEDLLRSYRLDYSVQSLARIDAFLDELRARNQIQQDDYLDDLAAQNLLYLLNFYVGEVIARCLRSQPHWYNYEEVKAVDLSAEYSGPIFENSASVGFPSHSIAKSKPWFRPLVSITARLFDEYPDKSVLFSAGFLLPQKVLDGPISQKPLPPLALPAWPIDVAEQVKQSPQLLGELEIEPPTWVKGDPLQCLFDHQRALLQGGRVVFGAIVQANSSLFKHDLNDGAPGDVLYDPRGRVPLEDLAELAQLVFSVKGSEHADPAVKPLCEHLSDEMTRVFGMDMPTSFIPYPLKLSTTYFHRLHLPGSRLAQVVIPLLVNDTCPGIVLPLPPVFWPSKLLEERGAAVEAVAAVANARGDHAGAYVPDPALAHLKPMSITEEGLLWFEQKDYDRARAAWEKSALTGNAGGLNGLGMLYEEGLGVAKDVARALEYYERAAALDYSRARDAIARIRGESGSGADRVRVVTLITQSDIEKWERQAFEGFNARQAESEIRHALGKSGCTPDYADQIMEYARTKVRRLRQIEGISLVVTGVILVYLTRVMVISQSSGGRTLLIGLLAGGLTAFGVYKIFAGERGRA